MSTRPRMQVFGSKTDRVLAAIDGQGPQDPISQGNASGQELDITLIDLPPIQPRRFFDPEKLANLAASIQEKGILEPLLVRPTSGGRYELIAGERRLRAATTLNLRTVPVVARNFSDAECLEIALIENLQREDLNPIEEVEGVLQFLGLKLQLTPAEVASTLYRLENEHKGKVTRNVTGNQDLQDGDRGQKSSTRNEILGDGDSESSSTRNVTGKIQQLLETLGIGSWQSFVRNKLPLLKLPEDILAVLRQGAIEYTKAKEIAKVKDAAQRAPLLQDAIAEKWSLSQIKQAVAALVPQTTTPTASFAGKVRDTFKLIRQAKLDPKRQRQLEKYLDQIQALLTD